MTRKGYHNISVTDAFHKKLKAEAEHHGWSLPQLLRNLLDTKGGQTGDAHEPPTSLRPLVRRVQPEALTHLPSLVNPRPYSEFARFKDTAREDARWLFGLT